MTKSCSFQESLSSGFNVVEKVKTTQVKHLQLFAPDPVHAMALLMCHTQYNRAVKHNNYAKMIKR